ncbi:MAG: OPT/YSL family transporter [Candidatus Hodarchaeota archaeon]
MEDKDDSSEEIQSLTKESYQSGFTWRIWLAIIYSAVILQPAAIYLYFVTNNWFIGAVLNTTIVLFAVLAKLADNPLSKQEVFIMMNVTSTALGMEMIVAVVFNYYLRHHPITKATIIDGISLTELIPEWFAPEYFGPLRSLFSPVFIIPIGLLIITALLSKAADISLGIVFNYLYTKVEVLPFPTAYIDAAAAKSLTWENKRHLQIFSISAIIASLIGLIIYAFPLVLNLSFIPIPWFDFNSSIEQILPGASFGIATDILAFATGFILPMNVVVSILIGSIFSNIIVNPILVANGLLPGWEPGMSLLDTYNYSQLEFWLPWTVGLIISASLIPILRDPRIFIKTIKDLRKLSQAKTDEFEGEMPRLSILISFFLLGTLGSAIVAIIIIPDLSTQLIVLLIILTVGWSFISTLALAYAFGITANLPGIPYIKESLFIAADAPLGGDIWFAPLVITQGGAGWVATFKTADLTFTKRMSLIKAHFIASFVAWGAGIFWVTALLSISQVPSVIFPVPFWTLDVGKVVTFVSNPKVVFNPLIVLITFFIVLILYGIEWGTAIPLSVISLVVGTTTAIPYALVTFFGALFARVLKGRMAEWESDRAIILAGLGAGLGIIISLATFLSLILNTIALPF